MKTLQKLSTISLLWAILLAQRAEGVIITILNDSMRSVYADAGIGAVFNISRDRCGDSYGFWQSQISATAPYDPLGILAYSDVDIAGHINTGLISGGGTAHAYVFGDIPLGSSVSASASLSYSVGFQVDEGPTTVAILYAQEIRGACLGLFKGAVQVALTQFDGEGYSPIIHVDMYDPDSDSGTIESIQLSPGFYHFVVTSSVNVPPPFTTGGDEMFAYSSAALFFSNDATVIFE